MEENKTENDKKLDALPAQSMPSKDDLLKLIEGDVASGVTKVYINSLSTEVSFKEITVT